MAIGLSGSVLDRGGGSYMQLAGRHYISPLARADPKTHQSLPCLLFNERFRWFKWHLLNAANQEGDLESVNPIRSRTPLRLIPKASEAIVPRSVEVQDRCR